MSKKPEKKKEIKNVDLQITEEIAHPSLKDSPTISAGIDVSSSIDQLVSTTTVKNIIQNNKNAISPEAFIENNIPIKHNEDIIVRNFSYGSNEKLNSFLRIKKNELEKKISQYKQVFNIYKEAGNFNRETAMNIAVRLSSVYSLPIVFDNTSGLFIFWNSNTKTHTTLDIFGGFGVTSIAGITNRNKFANYFNFSVWSLNIYGHLLSTLQTQLNMFDSISSGPVYDAVSQLMSEQPQIINIIVEILKEKR